MIREGKGGRRRNQNITGRGERGKGWGEGEKEGQEDLCIKMSQNIKNSKISIEVSFFLSSSSPFLLHCLVWFVCLFCLFLFTFPTLSPYNWFNDFLK